MSVSVSVLWDMHACPRTDLPSPPLLPSSAPTFLPGAEREHRARLNALQGELEADLSRLRATLSTRVAREKSGGQAEVHAAQQQFGQKLQEARLKHSQEMQALQQNFEEKKEKLVQQGREYRQQVEQEMREKNNSTYSDNRSAGSNDNGDASTNVLQLQAQQEAQTERDKRLQQEIRRLQSETVRLERDLKGKADEQRKHVLAAREREEQESHRRQRQLTETVAEQAITREKLAKQCSILSDNRKTLLEQVDSARQEIKVYEDGIAAHKMRVRDVQSTAHARIRDEELGYNSKADALKQRCDRLRTVAKSKEVGLNRDLKALEAMHHGEMERLDRAVSQDIQRKDSDLDMLRDAVQTYKVKVARLEKLVAAAAEAGTGAASGSGASAASAAPAMTNRLRAAAGGNTRKR